jgi:hypothetical protein
MADKSFNKLPKTNMPVTPKTSKFGKTPMPPATTKGLPRSGRVNMNRMSADDKSRQNPSFLSSVAGRIGIVAREIRDVPTAFMTDQKAGFQRGQGAQPGSKQLQTLVDNNTRARWNLKKQVKEVGTAITQGKKGTRSDQIKNTKYINKTPKKKK